MPRETVRVRGLREFQRAAKRAGPDARKHVRDALKEAVEPIRQDAIRRFSVIDQRSASGYTAFVTQRAAGVRQSTRKTTGRRPDYGALQMTRALLPALQDNADEIERGVERALDKVADHFERKP